MAIKVLLVLVKPYGILLALVVDDSEVLTVITDNMTAFESTAFSVYLLSAFLSNACFQAGLQQTGIDVNLGIVHGVNNAVRSRARKFRSLVVECSL